MSVARRVAIVLSLLLAPLPAAAQQTPADSAQVLLDAARLLRAQGRTRLADDVIRVLVTRYPGTPAALAAAALAPTVTEPGATQFGKTGFYIYSTLYGGFLGVAIPAAFGADGPEPYGVGLLVGAPLGFFGSRALAKSRNLTDGQAGVINFGSLWGTWQGIGWQQVFEWGEKTTCDYDCTTESDTAPWAAAVIGGVTGLGTALLASRGPVRAGTPTMIFNGSFWGTWYGLVTAILTDLDDKDDGTLTAALIGGNIGLLAAIPLNHAWRPSPSQVRLASAGGLAGGLAGLGFVLLFQVEDDKGGMAIASLGTTAGLVTGALLARNHGPEPGESALFDQGLVNVRDGVRLGIPLPTPTLIPLDKAKGPRYEPGFRFTLFDARF